MASLKSLRKRVASVKSTQQITKAMKMVAAARLRRAQEAATEARPYAEKIGALLHNVAARVGSDSHPLLAVREEVRHIDLIVVTSDRGLCGGYNANLLRRAENFLAEHSAQQVRLTVIGTRGHSYFLKRSANIVESFTGLRGGPGHDLAVQLGARVARDYAEGEVDAVYLVYSQFRSALSQVPTVEQVLPVSRQEIGDEAQADYIYEPDPTTLLDRLLTQYINTLIDRAFLEAVASEHGARMTAMDSATSNASDMIDRLTLEMNRARQAAITKELMEIVSGAEALKG